MRAGSTAKSEDLEKLKLESSAALDEKNQLVSDLENEFSAAKFAEIDKLVFEKTEKIMALESELKELEEAKQSLEEQNSRVDPAEIARKDIKIQKLEETLVRSG